jgi:hypothetical protein
MTTKTGKRLKMRDKSDHVRRGASSKTTSQNSTNSRGVDQLEATAGGRALKLCSAQGQKLA